MAGMRILLADDDVIKQRACAYSERRWWSRWCWTTGRARSPRSAADCRRRRPSAPVLPWSRPASPSSSSASAARAGRACLARRRAAWTRWGRARWRRDAATALDSRRQPRSVRTSLARRRSAPGQQLTAIGRTQSALCRPSSACPRRSNIIVSLALHSQQ